MIELKKVIIKKLDTGGTKRTHLIVSATSVTHKEPFRVALLSVDTTSTQEEIKKLVIDNLKSQKFVFTDEVPVSFPQNGKK
jgi:hypothetical protein